MKQRLATAAKGLVLPAIFVILYLAAKAMFAAWTEGEGLLKPSGDISLPVALSGVVVLVLRLVVVFVVPSWMAYRLVEAVLREVREAR